MALVGILFFCVLASLAFIIIKLPVFFAVPFAPGFAGLTFPMAIGIVASNKAAAFFTGAGQETLGYVVKHIAGVQILLASAIIGVVLLGIMKMIFGSG